MPIYEYACAKCESEFEVEQRITEDPVKTCPKCRSRRVKRLISQTSFVLKGGGWYSDLYSSNSTKDKNEGTGDSGGESSTADSTDSKDSKKSSESTEKKGKDKKASKKGSKKSPKAAA